MLGAFAQAESESISANVRWGKRQAMREGKTIIQYNRLYAYEKGKDGKPKIIQEQADVVRSIYDQYLSGASLRMIKDRLEAEQIPNVTGGSQWTITAIRSILTNEKYCGDVLLQKTYISDCISRKVIRNTGQLPMYLVQNHHEMDYVITHCAPNSIVDILGNGGYVHDHLTGFLEEVKERAKFHYWLFGHYHDNKIIDDRFVLLWEQMVQVV